MANTKISALTSATTPLAGTEVLPIVQSGATVKVANNDLRPKQIQSNATSGVLQITGPAASSTRVMTTPDANFTVARTDSAQTFSGLQTFSGGVSVTSGKLTTAYGGGGDFIAVFQNTSSSTPYCVWIKDAATPTAGYPLLNVSNSGGTTSYLRVDSSNGNTTITSNLVVAAAAKGVNFTANSAAAGMTSQLLNWYEEGTWTPSLGVNGFSGAPATTATSGTYTRIGRQVTVNLKLTFGSSTYPSTYCVVTGLPFVPVTPEGVGVYTGTNPGSGVQGGVVQVNTSSQVTFWPSTGTTTSSVWFATVTYFV